MKRASSGGSADASPCAQDEVRTHKLDLEEYDSQILHYTKLRAVKRRKIDDLMWKRREITDTGSFVSQGCPWDGCNGVVACDSSSESSVIKPCKSCERLVCFRCAAAIRMESHVCDEGDLQSARAIERECTKCPGCSASVYKITGCNHMFCTKCNTSFDNTNGKRISHSFGNVHFHDWVRSLSESERREVMMDIERQQARGGGGGGGGGGAFPGFDPLFGVWRFSRDIPADVRDLCMALNTLISHTARHRTARNTDRNNESYYGMKNRQYLKNELDRETYIQQIQRHLRVDMCIQEANEVVNDLVDGVREAIGRQSGSSSGGGVSRLMRADISIELDEECCNAVIEVYRAACSRMAGICSVASRPSLKQKVALDRFLVRREACALYRTIVCDAGLFKTPE